MTITTGAALFTAAGYSILIAPRTHLFWWDALLPAVALLILRPPLFRILKRLAALNLFLGMVAATVWLGHHNAEKALLILLRGNLIIALNLILFSGRTAFDLFDGMRSLKMPNRFTTVLFFTAKYISILHAEYLRMRESIMLRGFRPKTNLFTYKTMATQFGMLIVRSMRSLSTMQDAMELRGFSGTLPRLSSAHTTHGDTVIILLLAVHAFLIAGGIV